ncbi:MAG: LytR family transcriptional regulator, partial [Mycolicibacter sinensis]
MVAQITSGTEFDKHGLPFRRRNYRPAAYALAALSLLTAVAWTVALTRPADMHEAAVCNPPPAPTEP